MAVSLEALAMAGEDPDSLNYTLTIEEWESKFVLKPAPHLLSPKSSSKCRSEKISCKNYPLFLFYLPKKHEKSCDCGGEEERKRSRFMHHDGCNSGNDEEEDEHPRMRKRKRKKGSMAKGFKEFGDMAKRISGKIVKFFSGAIKKKKRKSIC